MTAAWRRPGSLLLVLVVTLSGCGLLSPSPSPAPLAACALVPDMDALVGRPALDRPAAFTLNGVDRCIWTYAVDPSRTIGLSVASIVAHGAAIEAFGDGESVPDLAHDARWWPGSHTLSVALGERALQVDLQIEDASATRDLAVRIAQSAIANLD